MGTLLTLHSVFFPRRRWRAPFFFKHPPGKLYCRSRSRSRGRGRVRGRSGGSSDVDAGTFGGDVAEMDPVEAYVQQLVAQGYPEETARAYAQQYYAQAAQQQQ